MSFAGREDRQLVDKLKAEREGILRWAIEGCLRWQEEGLEPPEEVRTATNSYRTEMDILGDFLGDRCVREGGASIPKGELYQVYRQWAGQNGEKHPMSQKQLGIELAERGFDEGRTKHGRFWYGLRLAGDTFGDG